MVVILVFTFCVLLLHKFQCHEIKQLTLVRCHCRSFVYAMWQICDKCVCFSFSFLASAGLMTCADEPASPQANDKAQADTTQLPVSTAADQKDLERIR